MGHDDSPHNAHSLEERPVITASAARDEQPLEDLHLVWLGHAILVAEGDSHDGNEESEERLKLAQAIAIQREEGEGVGNGQKHTTPERDAAEGVSGLRY